MLSRWGLLIGDCVYHLVFHRVNVKGKKCSEGIKFSVNDADDYNYTIKGGLGKTKFSAGNCKLILIDFYPFSHKK